MKLILENRGFVSFLIACAVGLCGLYLFPFNFDNHLLEQIRRRSPHIFDAFYWGYSIGWFTTPFLMCLITLSGIENRILKGRSPSRNNS